MVPSIGFEPMTFPMSRERATPAPTGLKTILLFIKRRIKPQLLSLARVPLRERTYFTSPAPTGLKSISIIPNLTR